MGLSSGGKQTGFTLIELMITVAIIGILAAVAIPAFTKYVKKARTTEARIFVKKIYDGARSYYLDSTSHAPGMVQIAAQFPDSTVDNWYPQTGCCSAEFPAPIEKCLPSQSIWSLPTWQALHFSVDDPHYYSYDYDRIPSATGGTTAFQAEAKGDLDCDGEWSYFVAYGDVNSAYADGPTGHSEPMRMNELE